MVAAIAGLILAALSNAVTGALQSQTIAQERNQLTQEANFAMQRMVRAVQKTNKLFLPMRDNPKTGSVNEALRNPGVIAVALDPSQDLDGNGIADADNDGDGKVDEDLPADTNNDGEPGIRGIDDDGNGTTDFFLSPAGDDDESNNLAQSEDKINGADDDGDGNIDEDPGADNNGDGCAGVCGIDDDGDGSTDEGDAADDDEDGSEDEDWYDTVVFYLNNGVLIERMPNLNPSSGSDFTERTLADNVSMFVVERIPTSENARAELISINLQLTGAGGELISLKTQVRISRGN